MVDSPDGSVRLVWKPTLATHEGYEKLVEVVTRVWVRNVRAGANLAPVRDSRLLNKDGRGSEAKVWKSGKLCKAGKVPVDVWKLRIKAWEGLEISCWHWEASVWDSRKLDNVVNDLGTFVWDSGKLIKADRSFEASNQYLTEVWNHCPRHRKANQGW